MPLLPSLSRYDPLSASEGTLDPLGLYQISDQLAVTLVPAVRERMSRIRFLTVMAVGAAVVEDLEDRQEYRDASPFLVWEWLVVEALVRHAGEDGLESGVPGSLVTRRAMSNHGYLDAASYLKTPRIFGFHGVYKRLAVHLGLVDVNLGVGPNAGQLLDAWARDQGFEGFEGARDHIKKWREGVIRSLRRSTPRTDPNWRGDDWTELAESVTPFKAGTRERRVLRQQLLTGEEDRLGALPDLWRIAQEHDGDTLSDQEMHRLLHRASPRWRPLLAAITFYEAFARALQDCFDALRDAAGATTGHGYRISDIKDSEAFCISAQGLDELFLKAGAGLHDAGGNAAASAGLFDERFGVFAVASAPAELATTLIEFHQAIQRAKSAEGKRSWFDRLGPNQVHLRFPYRLDGWEPKPGTYVHPYRTNPVLNFLGDLG